MLQFQISRQTEPKDYTCQTELKDFTSNHILSFKDLLSVMSFGADITVFSDNN